MSQIKVKRSLYNKARQTELAKYAQVIVSKTFENPTYVDVAPQVAILKEKADAYDAALIAAAEGGRNLVFIKNQLKQEVILALDNLANMAEVYCKGNEEYIFRMGFEPRKKPVRHRLPIEAPEMPVDIFAKSTGNVGELLIRFKLPNGDHVVNVAVEHRIYNVGAPYTNGKYMDSPEMILTGLPQLQMVELRFCSIGKNGLKSEWTAPIVVPVL